MNDEDKNMFQQMSSSHSQFHPPSSSSINDQDELIARKKLEQKRRFQQKPGTSHKDVDSLMQTMFSDLKLQPKTTATSNSSESKRPVLQISELPNNSAVHHSPPQMTVSGAADWSKIAFDDELTTVFHQKDHQTSNIPVINPEDHSIEQFPSFTPTLVYPSWCMKPLAFLPLVYQQVFEASYRSHVIETSVLYPILLLSGLKQDQLSQIWSQVNLTQPGVLVKEELFMALALIALAQNSDGLIYPNDHLFQLTDIPVPHFQIQQEQTSPISPPPPPPPSVYEQENFANFASFEQTNNDAGGGDDVLLDFDTNHLYPPEVGTIPSDTQSIASLDLIPIPSMNTTNSDDATSQKGISDNISFSSSNNNEIIQTAEIPSTLSTNSVEPSKLELTQFSFFSDDTSENDSQTAVWLRCFEKCFSIISQANEIFSSIESPLLCTEVLQQIRARDYVHHLHEIFHVHKRIYTAAVLEPTTTNELTSLWKQTIVLWTNLQSFFSTAHLHLLNDDDIDYSSLLSGESSSSCSICLLSTVGLDKLLPNLTSFSLNTACLTFAGRLYHASCANFYLNLIDGILPSLRRSS